MRYRLDKLEFYITNVCNLACPECNRFNNHDFKGHQLWREFERDYQQWKKLLNVSSLVILGGEPLLNPSICDWITGLNQCFNQSVQVLTNGTRLNKTPGLYEALISYKGNPFNSLGIHVHNSDDLDQYIHEVEKFLRGGIQKFHTPKGSHSPSLRQTLPTFKQSMGAFERSVPYFRANYTWIDENNVGIRLWVSNSFHSSSIRPLPPRQIDGEWQAGGFGVYNNDPVKSHDACAFVHWKNYHMIRGRLYKCGPSVLMADFDKQHALDISSEDREILHAYRGLSAWDSPETIDHFLTHIDNVIPQCKFCPSAKDNYNTTIFAKSKKRGSTGTFG